MSISPCIRDLICCKQTSTEGEEFDRQAYHVFANSEQGYVDVQIAHDGEIPLTHGPKSAPSAEKLQLSYWTAKADDPLTRVHTVEELQRFLNQCAKASITIYVRQRNSRSRLSASRQLFEIQCDKYGAFQKLREVVLCFGVRKSDVYANAPAMWFNVLEDGGNACSHGGHIGFEIAYILRFVEPNQRAEGFTYSLRQSAVYHQFRASENRRLWLYFGLSATLEKSLNAYCSAVKYARTYHPLEQHYLFLEVATAGWKGYIAYLSEEIQGQSDVVFMTEVEPNDFSMTRLEQRQYLKRIDDFIVNLSMAITHMRDNVRTLIHCVELYEDEDTSSFSQENRLLVHQAERCILQKVFERQRDDLIRFGEQFAALHQKVQSVSTLVSNILELSNGDALKLLAVETKVENARTALMTRKAVEDAATVKVLTIITLVYLHLTVVTNFFSTSFVNSEKKVDSWSGISVTSDVWILFVVGIPLTAMTILIWWVFAQREINGRYPGYLQYFVQYVSGGMPGRRKHTGPPRVDRDNGTYEL